MNTAADEERVLQAARDYLAELEAGRRPDRQAYLDRDPELADALAEAFDGIELAQALRPTASPEQREYPVNPLGDFQIIRQVGSGGMGVVYEAVQLSLGRRVALKILPFAAALDAKHLQRFKTEAHAAAQLHHTNIVPVYFIGHERGVHFYVMQLIEGRSLDQVIRELRGEASPFPNSRSGRADPSPISSGGIFASMSPQEAGATTAEFRAGLPPIAPAPSTGRPGSATLLRSARSSRARESYRTAARIALQVADALAYAHDAGVIHRDVKPANLLLDGKGTVWVTDFGLAQVSADVSITKTGEVMGTLRYMSPEQACGQRVLVDHRTDVYSLGATLYELLTLEPIFTSQDKQSLFHAILHEEPRPPRQLDRSIPVELETIVLKALSKAPGDRYATAGEMAADLRRFLDEQPILARRPSLVDRTRKWMRRHPAFMRAAVVFLILGMVGFAITTALIAAEQSRTQAAYEGERVAYERERQRAREAEERFQLARRAADDLIQMAGEELAGQPQLEDLRKSVLESALAYYQKFIELRQDDPDAQAELAITRDRVKNIVDDLALVRGTSQYRVLGSGGKLNDGILKDLQVSDEQRGRIADVTRQLEKAHRELMHDFYKLNAAKDREDRFIELARADAAAIADVLSADQLRRLQQLALQFKGLAAFQERHIYKALDLKPEQRQKIREIQAIEGAAFFSSFGKGPRFGPGRPGISPEQARKTALEQARVVLTKDQWQRWSEMTGELYDAPMPPMFFAGKGFPSQGKDKKGGPPGPR